MPVMIIAEAGVNHNGCLDTAKQLVDVAAQCGADAVKFQTFKVYESVGAYAEMAQYQKENISAGHSQYEMLKKLELPFTAFYELKEYCRQKNILFISTPDGKESLDFLMQLEVPFIKVGSTEVTNPWLLKQIGMTGKPVILSTGMSTLGEVEKALENIYSAGCRDVSLMHCTTDYPTNPEDVNLKAMVTLRDAFKLPVGLSDHTLGCEAAVAAVALGADFIEKHITLDKSMEGPDHKASMSPTEFAAYVRSIRDTEKLLGNGVKRPTAREILMMKDVRRSVVAAKELKAGTRISENLICFKRPGYGIKPEDAAVLIGRILKRDLKADEPICWEDI